MAGEAGAGRVERPRTSTPPEGHTASRRHTPRSMMETRARSGALIGQIRVPATPPVTESTFAESDSAPWLVSAPAGSEP